MHGAAAELFVRILKENQIGYNAFYLNPDDTFGGKMPDPKEKYLQELKTVSKKTNKIGLSNDGDGDRFGAFNEYGEFVTANEIIAILFKHLKENKKHTGKLVKTIGASSMLNIIAAKHNTRTYRDKSRFQMGRTGYA
jgi:phosphomannomutase